MRCGGEAGVDAVAVIKKNPKLFPKISSPKMNDRLAELKKGGQVAIPVQNSVKTSSNSGLMNNDVESQVRPKDLVN